MGKKTTVRDIGERGLYQRIQSILGPSPDDVLVGIGDDAAVFSPRDKPVVITKDVMVEDIHFHSNWTFASNLAYKALASNISDLASKGAEPVYGLIALGLPVDTSLDWIDEFYQTLALLREEWGLYIIGGDTVRSEKIFVSITALGYQIPQEPIRISTAQTGDRILVTGTLGDAAAGLEILQQEKKQTQSIKNNFLVQRFLHPSPRMKEMKKLLAFALPSSMTDISDGLSRDLPKLCQASHVGAIVDMHQVPISGALRKWSKKPAGIAWRGGEDYELLLTLPPDQSRYLLTNWNDPKCPITEIGEVTPFENRIEIQNWDGPPVNGFDHFS